MLRVVSLTSLILLAFVLAANAVEARAKYPHVAVKPGKPPAKDLALFIDQLRAAMQAKDESLILSKVADDFECLRDFGGACEAEMSATAKFKSSLGFEGASGGNRFGHLEELLQATRFAKTTAVESVKAPLLCAPAVPQFDEAKVQAIDKRLFKGDDGEFWLSWIAIEAQGVPVFKESRMTAKRIATLSRELVHLGSPPSDIGEGWTAIDLPSGQSGFVEERQVSWLLPVQICYKKHPKLGWQIAAHIGGGD